MRNGFGLAAGLLVLSWFAVAALSPPGAKVQVAPNAVAETGKVVRPGGLHQSLPVGALPLTADECTGLGGSVVTNNFGDALCKSKKLCVRKDNNGQNHAVCLESQ
jgi:hypothetical protein